MIKLMAGNNKAGVLIVISINTISEKMRLNIMYVGNESSLF